MQAEKNSKGKILCIDDEPFILTLLSRILTIEGYSVLTALTPTKAIEIVDNEDSIDLIISDYLMPEITGT
ncbi:MAG: response regulator, partial [Bdellovibrionales bacterium]|nr:response regulator [Bdellovibrionales bacterium]